MIDACGDAAGVLVPVMVMVMALLFIGRGRS